MSNQKRRPLKQCFRLRGYVCEICPHPRRFVGSADLLNSIRAPFAIEPANRPSSDAAVAAPFELPISNCSKRSIACGSQRQSCRVDGLLGCPCLVSRNTFTIYYPDVDIWQIICRCCSCQKSSREGTLKPRFGTHLLSSLAFEGRGLVNPEGVSGAGRAKRLVHRIQTRKVVDRLEFDNLGCSTRTTSIFC